MASGASNLALRFATAAVAVPVILYSVFIAPPVVFYVIAFIAGLVGVHELLSMTHPGDALSRAAGLVVAAAASIAVYFHFDDPRVLLTVLCARADHRAPRHPPAPGLDRDRRIASPARSASRPFT